MEVSNYMHPKLGKGRATAAICIEKEEGSDTEVAHVSMSFCAPEDQFCKKTGRDLASDRAKASQYLYSISLDPEKQVSVQVREAISASICRQDKRFPAWATRGY